MSQVPPALAIAPPDNEIDEAPLSAVRVPPQPFDAGVLLVILIPIGRESVNEIPLTAVSNGAVNRMCNFAFVPGAIGFGEKSLAIFIGVFGTITPKLGFDLISVFLAPSPVVISSTGIVLE